MLFADNDFSRDIIILTAICEQKSIHGKSSVATPTAIYNNVSVDTKHTNIRSSNVGTHTVQLVADLGSEFALGKGDRLFLVTSNR